MAALRTSDSNINVFCGLAVRAELWARTRTWLLQTVGTDCDAVSVIIKLIAACCKLLWFTSFYLTSALRSASHHLFALVVCVHAACTARLLCHSWKR